MADNEVAASKLEENDQKSSASDSGDESSASSGSGDDSRSESGKSQGSDESPKFGGKHNKKKPRRIRRAVPAAAKPKAAKPKGKDRYVERAAEESDDEGGVRAASDDDSDEDDDDEEAAEVRRGFIVDSDEDSGASDSESGSESDSDAGSSGSEDRPRARKLRRLASKEKEELDEDDLALVAEAAEDGAVQLDERAKRKIQERLGKAGARSSAREEPAGITADEARAFGLSASSAAAVAAAAASEKRGAGAGADDEPKGDAAAPKTTVFDEEYDSEGLDDFIVQDDEEGDGAGEGKARARRAVVKRRRGEMGALGGATSEQVSLYQDIFGSGAVSQMFGSSSGAGMDLSALYADEPEPGAGLAGQASDDDEGEDEEDDDYLPPEAKAAKKAAKAAAKAAAAKAASGRAGVRGSAVVARREDGRAVKQGDAVSELEKKRRDLAAAVEPAVFEQFYLRDEDVAIRGKDEPERLQVMLKARRERSDRVAKAVAAAEAGGLVETLASDSTSSRTAEVDWMSERLCISRERAHADPYCDITPSMSLLPLELRASEEGREAVAHAVTSVLRGVLDEGLEVPFLWTYRRDDVVVCPGMGLGHMWTVLDLDEVWSRVQARRIAVAAAVDKAYKAGHLDAPSYARLGDELLSPSTLSSRAVEDVAAYADLLISAGEAAVGAQRRLGGGFELGSDGQLVTEASQGGKSAAEAIAGGAKVDLYRLAHASDTRKLLPQVFMPSHELAANVRAEAPIHTASGLGGGAGDTPDTADGLKSLAFNCLDDHFADEESVIKAARYVAALDIAREPTIRRTMRETFFSFATVRTEPTAKGRVELDPSHPYFGLHTLRGKAIAEFASARPARAEGSRSDKFQEAYSTLVDDEYPSTGWEVGDKLPSHGSTHSVPTVDDNGASGFGAQRYVGPDALGLPDGYGSHMASARVQVMKNNPDVGPRPKPGDATYGEQFARAVRHEARVGGPSQWLLLARAEADGLITVTIEPGHRWLSDNIRRLTLYSITATGLAQLGDRVDPMESELASEADVQRRAAVQTALEKILLPEFLDEARLHLARLAHEAVAAEYACALRRRVLQAPPVVPPQPLRKRKDKGGDEDEAMGQAKGEQPTAEPALAPWVRARYRVMVVVISRPGDRRLTNDTAVLIDPRGDLVDSQALPNDRAAREIALSEFMFAHAPDVVVMNSSSGLNRCRDMKRAVLDAAVACDALVKKARQNAKKRKELRRLHGHAVAHSRDERVKAEYDATFLGAHLETSAEKWSSGKWKFIRPRAPATKVETDRSGVQKVVADEANSTLPVLWVDDDVAHVFVASSRTRHGGLSEQSPVVRYAVALGRYSQDPLAEVTYLWATRGDASLPAVAVAREAGVTSITTEILGARLHPLQDATPAHLLFGAAERVMTEAAAAVGVDLNGVAKREHLSTLLQFVPGLGPRKAVALLDAIVGGRVEGGVVLSRGQLADKQLLSALVFRNAVAFLRINPPWAIMGPRWRGTGQRESDLRAERDRVDFNVGRKGRGNRGPGADDQAAAIGDDPATYSPLDSTRIHPEHADLALQFLQEVPKEMSQLVGQGQDVLAQLGEWGMGWNDEDGGAGDWANWNPTDPSSYRDGARFVMERLSGRLSSWLQAMGVAFSQFRARPVVMGLAGSEADPAVKIPTPKGQPPLDPSAVPPGEREPGDFLEQLDLDAFSNVLAQGGKAGLRHVLELIKGELRAPYREPRRPWPSPSPAALFRLFTGESTMSMRRGAVVTASVDRVMDERISVRLDNGLRGTISARNTDVPMDMATFAPLQPLSTLYKEGQAVTIRITRIGRAGFYVDGSAKASDVRTAGWPLVDEACDVEAAARILEDNLKALETAAARAALESGAGAELVAGALTGHGAQLRAISHPAFKNVARTEALEFLSTQPLYTALFRPSSLGIDHLTLTWKLGEPNLAAHIDILEEGKDSNNPAALGTTIVVDKHYRYGDLDEALARYVEPAASQHRALRASRVFRDEASAGVEEFLQAQMQETRKIPYCICPDLQAVGMYRLCYMWKGGKVRHEPVKVTPTGLLWRGQVSKDWRRLIDDFKGRVMRPYDWAKDREQRASAEIAAAASTAPPAQQPMQAQGQYGQPGGYGQVPQKQPYGAYGGPAYGQGAPGMYGAASGPAAGPQYGYGSGAGAYGGQGQAQGAANGFYGAGQGGYGGGGAGAGASSGYGQAGAGAASEWDAVVGQQQAAAPAAARQSRWGKQAGPADPYAQQQQQQPPAQPGYEYAGAGYDQAGYYQQPPAYGAPHGGQPMYQQPPPQQQQQQPARQGGRWADRSY